MGFTDWARQSSVRRSGREPSSQRLSGLYSRLPLTATPCSNCHARAGIGRPAGQEICKSSGTRLVCRACSQSCPLTSSLSSTSMNTKARAMRATFARDIHVGLVEVTIAGLSLPRVRFCMHFGFIKSQICYAVQDRHRERAPASLWAAEPGKQPSHSTNPVPFAAKSLDLHPR